MGEALQGFELEFSGLDVNFKQNKEKSQYCSVLLIEDNYQPFMYAVKNNYWYQMYVDDLPVWGIVGDGRRKRESGNTTFGLIRSLTLVSMETRLLM